MKITVVTPRVLGTPWRNLNFVKVETGGGIYGLGEVRIPNRTNALLRYPSEARRCYVTGHDLSDDAWHRCAMDAVIRGGAEASNGLEVV
jgi:galactonate dehydratase